MRNDSINGTMLQYDKKQNIKIILEIVVELHAKTLKIHKVHKTLHVEIQITCKI